MNKAVENIIDKTVTRVMIDRDTMSENIKETCKRLYDEGYKDGFNKGFRWNLIKDRLPNDKDDRIVVIYFCKENSNGDYEDTTVKTGYYHNGEWFVEGRPLYFDGDYGEKVVAWADFPIYDD